MRRKSAQLDVLEHNFKDLKNKLAGFKKQMVGVCRKYDQNFQETGVAHSHLHRGWISHEATILKINERCTCGASDSEDDFETVETISSPSPVGTPPVPNPLPLLVVPSFEVRWVTRASVCEAFLTCRLQMRLLPEEVPLPSSLEASAVRGRQRAVPSDPLVRRCMAKKLAACRESIPYGGVAKRRRRSRTASTSPDLSPQDERNPTAGASLYCGSYGETSNSSSLCSRKVVSKSRGDCLPCSCERFPWDHSLGARGPGNW